MRITIGKFTTTTEELISAWHVENDKGNGYAPESEDVAIAAEDELSDAVKIEITGEMAGLDGDNLIVICNANGAWACDVTEIISKGM